MSYILDALKKSEQQRPPGPVPDLFTVQGPQPLTPRWPARVIVAVALLLSMPALALWAWVYLGGRDERAARPPAEASSQLRSDAAAAPAIPRTAVAPTPPALARATDAAAVAAADRAAAADPAVGGGPVAEQPQTAAALAQKSRGAVSSAVVTRTGSVVPPVPGGPARGATAATPVFVPPVAVAASPAARPPQPKKSGKTVAAPVPARKTASGDRPAAPPVTALEPVPEPIPVPVPAVVAAEQTPPADGRVLNLAELPAPLRAALPKLLVSGHVWSEESALRLLSVDDRILYEGGEAAPGVRLLEITPTGAVFVFQGWHFRVAVGQQ